MTREDLRLIIELRCSLSTVMANFYMVDEGNREYVISFAARIMRSLYKQKLVSRYTEELWHDQGRSTTNH